MPRSRRISLWIATALSMVMLVPGLAAAAPLQQVEAESPPESAPEATAERAQFPEDRYALAGGCYALRSPGGWYVTRHPNSGGYRVGGATAATAEPFHLQATDLGTYLLFGSDQKFLAVSEGVVGQGGNAVTESQPGAMAGGVALEQSDRAAEEAARSQANVGRGASVVAADAPSDLADWTVTELDGGGFSLRLPVVGRALGVGQTGDLTTFANRKPRFRPELTDGCAEFPEIDVNIDGPVRGGESEFQEVRGFLDAHLHMMAFEFLGGRARCGRPWHPYGVTYALVDCADHEPGGQGAVLEQILSKREGQGHNTDGWPTFEGWPKHYSLTHEQVYYKWLERAWRGGLRMFVNLLVDNNQLCKIYPFKRNSCNEMDGVRLQAKRIRELERYIDAQNGGPGEGWFRIVENPFEARRVINEGKLAVVLGIEVSVPLNCGLLLDSPQCDLDDVEKGLDEVYDLGVRQMELVNKFDNAFSGVAGDSGTTGIVVNQGNKGETGEYWNMETCDESEGHAHDNTQMNFHDDGGMPDEFTGRDALAGGILALNGALGVLPIYPQGPHCNVLELSALGEAMIRGMVDRGMIFDPDHMSARAQTQALDLVESLGYSGIVSSHGWSNDTIYPRIYELGGVITPYAGGSAGFVHNYFHTKAWADDRYYFGFGFGSDVNGFGSQGGPRSNNASNPVTYPFTGFGGVTVNQQQSGTYTYDINSDGVSHYGLYPDWIEDLRRQAGGGIVEDMARGPEAYLQMWERAIGVAPDSCRSDIEDLTDAQLGQLAVGMGFRDVLSTLGQPSERTSTAFRYCLSGFREATVTFDDIGGVADWEVSSL